MVKVNLHVYQNFEVSHNLPTVNKDNRASLKTSIRTQAFAYILGVILVTPSQPASNNGEDITQLLDGTTKGHKVLRRNVQIFLADRRDQFAALVKHSEQKSHIGGNPWLFAFHC